MNLKDVLCQALVKLGADADAYQFDDHSTIVMSFDDIGDIYLDPLPDEKIWMWGILDELNEQARDALAVPLLAELVRIMPYWESGAMVLREDGRIGGLLHPECVGDATQLAVALREFHECLGRLKAIR